MGRYKIRIYSHAKIDLKDVDTVQIRRIVYEKRNYEWLL